MAEFDLESIIKSGVEKALNTPVHGGKTISEWAAIGMKNGGGWISVKDRLPERPPNVDGRLVRRKWFLVALKSGDVLSLSYEFDEDRWQGFGSPVTHWMPLPEPPKEESNE